MGPTRIINDTINSTYKPLPPRSLLRSLSHSFSISIFFSSRSSDGCSVEQGVSGVPMRQAEVESEEEMEGDGEAAEDKILHLLALHRHPPVLACTRPFRLRRSKKKGKKEGSIIIYPPTHSAVPSAAHDCVVADQMYIGFDVFRRK